MKIISMVLTAGLLSSTASGAVVPPSPLLDFSLRPGAIKEICRKAGKKAEAGLSRLVSVPAGSRNFANTVAAFESAVQDYSDTVNGPVFLSYISTDKKVRDAANECEIEAGKFGVEVYAREDIYRALKVFEEKTYLKRFRGITRTPPGNCRMSS